MNRALQKQWEEVTNLLLNAREILNNCSGSIETINDNNFKQYLDHNELELALDEIEAISDSFELPREFWQCILKAANVMELKEHSKRYLKSISYYG